MKKLTLIGIILFLIIQSAAIAQLLNQDSEGKSSIIYQGSTIGLDVTDASILFSLTNISDKKGVIWGFSLKGKNSSGVADLFKEGKLQPDVSISGTIGKYWAYDSIKEIKTLRKKIKEEEIKLNKLKEEHDEKLNKYFNNSISNLDEKDKKAISILKNDYLLNRNLSGLDKKLKNYRDNSKDNRIKTAKDKILSNIDSYFNNLGNLEKSIIEKRMSLKNEEDRAVRNNLWIYLNFGVNPGKFKKIGDIDGTELKDNFTDEGYRKGFINIGLNFLRGASWLFGASCGIEKSDNFSDLKKEEFTIETTHQTISNENLVSHEKITAYKGEYKKFTQMTINTDVIKHFKLGIGSLAWNILYIRAKFPLKTADFPNFIDCGTGAFFLKKGSLLGGIYVEADDLFNNIKGTDEEDEDFWDRLKIGIVVKFTFDSFLLPLLK